MWKEFREFIMRGNVIDLAVAVVIGAAFAGITNSLVNDIIMPLIGIILGGINFTSLTITIGNAVVKYGNFIQAIVNFLIISAAMFLLVKVANAVMRRRPPEPPPAMPTGEEKLLSEIRDLLRMQVDKM